MSNPSKNKGSRFEREVVHLARARGLDAFRVPLSGAAAGFKGDVIISGNDIRSLTCECKIRKGGLSFLYNNITGADVLFYRTDRGHPLAIIRAEDFFDLIYRY